VAAPVHGWPLPTNLSWAFAISWDSYNVVQGESIRCQLLSRSRPPLIFLWQYNEGSSKWWRWLASRHQCETRRLFSPRLAPNRLEIYCCDHLAVVVRLSQHLLKEDRRNPSKLRAR
jgi:hypothetical protein